MSSLKWKILAYIIIIIGILSLGFYLGRKTCSVKTVIHTEYIKGETIRDTIKVTELKPYKVVAPVDTADIIMQCVKDGIYYELFPEKVRTEYVEVTKEDTTKILQDWATERNYSNTLFNCDTLGLCIVNSIVQYNRLKMLHYEFTPMTKVVTETKYDYKLFSPFVGTGFMTNAFNNNSNIMGEIDGGFFIKEKYGLQLRYQHAFTSKDNYVGGIFLYKFR